MRVTLQRMTESAKISVAPSPRLGLAVVIPSRAEAGLIATLESLWRCHRPSCDVEIIVVINASCADEAAVHERNRATLEALRRWQSAHHDRSLRVHALSVPDLPARHAGVGLARRLGLDEAAARLLRLRRDNAPLVWFDADCQCDENYLCAIEAHFRDHPRSPGCSIYFEHPLRGELPRLVYEGMVRYELFLRYYRAGLLCARFPYAHYTLGSCLAVRSGAYRRAGGMNRRRAGEDFYFAQKIIALGGYTELNATRVIPAARLSARVPFGTGAALKLWVERGNRDWPVYAPAAFSELAEFVARAPALYRARPGDPALLDGWPAVLRAFLNSQGFAARLAEIQCNTASAPTFRRRLYHWFNAFRAMKFIHYASEHRYAKEPLARAARTLLARQTPGMRIPGEVGDLLARFRALDRARGPAVVQF